MSWEARAHRILNLLEGSSSEQEDRTWQIMNHVLDTGNSDEYISRDFYNVQQTAGGLPENVTFDGFVSMVAGHVRSELQGGSFDDYMSDEDIRTAALTFDDNIRRHIRFLNGVVHQGAPGEVHLGLWDLILSSRENPRSIYSCYRDYLVDA